MKPVVIYYSKYGHTKQYAEAIARRLNCPMFSIETANNKDLTSFDTIIFGSALYAGKMKGKEFLDQTIDKNLVIFTVGLSEPEVTDYSEIMKMSLSPQAISKAKIYHYLGGMTFNQMSFMDRMLMRMMKKMKFDKTPVAEQSTNFRHMMDHYYEGFNYFEESAIDELVAEVEKKSK